MSEVESVVPIRQRERPARENSDAATLDRIERYIRNPPENSRLFTITPKVAEALLDKYNHGNRSKKPGKIDAYTMDILSGRWLVTGDTIKFSDTQTLRDGQNRLMACVRAGKPFQTHLMFGVSDQSFSKMDQGRNRSGGDVLQIAGFRDTNALSSAVRWLYLFENNRVKQRDTLSPDDVLRLMQERYGHLPDYLLQAGRIYSVMGQPKGMVAALLYMFHKKSPGKFADWATAWENGQDAGVFKPMSLATKELQRLKTVSSGRVHDAVRAAIWVKAWNLYVTGSRGRMTDMHWTPQQDFPEIMGDNTRLPARRGKRASKAFEAA